MEQRPRVTVLGSLNTDISVVVPHLPAPGETVLSPGGAVIGSGGKGANQAVAAARLGAAVRMVGCCGDDEFGRRLRAGLAAEGVNASGVRAVAGAASGLALITVDTSGENAIAVAAGANSLAGNEEVGAALAAPCEVLVLSAEIPVRVLAAALERARAAGVMCVLNLAPMPAGAADLLAAGAAWLVVNPHGAAGGLGPPLRWPAGGGEGAGGGAAGRRGAGARQLATPFASQQQVGDVETHVSLLWWVGLLALSFDQGFVKVAQRVGYFFRYQNGVCTAKPFNVFHRRFLQTLQLAVDTAQQQMRGQAIVRKFDRALQVANRHIEGFHLVMQVSQVEICRRMAQPGFKSALQFAGGLGV